MPMLFSIYYVKTQSDTKKRQNATKYLVVVSRKEKIFFFCSLAYSIFQHDFNKKENICILALNAIHLTESNRKIKMVSHRAVKAIWRFQNFSDMCVSSKTNVICLLMGYHNFSHFLSTSSSTRYYLMDWKTPKEALETT